MPACWLSACFASHTRRLHVSVCLCCLPDQHVQHCDPDMCHIDHKSLSCLWRETVSLTQAPQTVTSLQGHSDTVEDVVFQPGSSAELASVADDTNLLFWDTRSGIAPVLRMAQAHGSSDLHVVDWSSLRPELVATGAHICLASSVKASHCWKRLYMTCSARQAKL